MGIQLKRDSTQEGDLTKERDSTKQGDLNEEGKFRDSSGKGY